MTVYDLRELDHPEDELIEAPEEKVISADPECHESCTCEHGGES